MFAFPNQCTYHSCVLQITQMQTISGFSNRLIVILKINYHNSLPMWLLTNKLEITPLSSYHTAIFEAYLEIDFIKY